MSGSFIGLTPADAWAVQPEARKPHRGLDTVGDLLRTEYLPPLAPELRDRVTVAGARTLQGFRA